MQPELPSTAAAAVVTSALQFLLEMSYQIADEPHATSLSDYVCKPDAPLLAMMLCGAWLAWPWFIFNSIALGSPTWKREIALVLVSIAGTVALGWSVFALLSAGLITIGTQLQLAFLLVTTWKLGTAYAISTIQARTFHVHAYDGGEVRSSSAVMSLGYRIAFLVILLFDDPLWRVIVSMKDVLS